MSRSASSASTNAAQRRARGSRSPSGVGARRLRGLTIGENLAQQLEARERHVLGKREQRLSSGHPNVRSAIPAGDHEHGHRAGISDPTETERRRRTNRRRLGRRAEQLHQRLDRAGPTGATKRTRRAEADDLLRIGQRVDEDRLGPRIVEIAEQVRRAKARAI